MPDIMHDVLEGVLPMCVKHLLSNLIERSVISFTELNRRIDAYEFGAIEGANRPRGNITTTKRKYHHYPLNLHHDYQEEISPLPT